MSDATGLVGTGLTMRFGGVAALQDVDVTLEPGGSLGLIGPNGSGKTTLLNVISGVYRASSGSLLLGGAEVVGKGPGARARLGIVRTFQHPQLASSLTLLENVRVGERLGRSLRRRRDDAGAGLSGIELLEMFGCAEYANELPERAPYGAGKLAEVARAAAAAPPILLLDEPAAGLSAEERGELVAALRAYATANPHTSLCLVEHDVPLVSSVCSQLLVLNAGRLLHQGAPEAVLADQRVRDAYLGPSHEPTPAGVAGTNHARKDS